MRRGVAQHDNVMSSRAGLGLDGNPMRRRTGKIAAVLVALLAAAFLIGGPQ